MKVITFFKASTFALCSFWVGCDTNTEPIHPKKAAALPMSELITQIPSSWTLKTAIDSTSIVLPTGGHFPIQVTPKINAKTNRPTLRQHGVVFVSDGTKGIAHFELQNPLTSRDGAPFSAYEMDGETGQIAKTSVTKVDEGYRTNVIFYPHPRDFNNVKVTIFDQEGDITTPLFSKKIDRSILENGVTDLLAPDLGECIGSNEEIRLCKEYSNSNASFKTKSANKLKFVQGVGKFCVPTSIANVGIDYRCWNWNWNSKEAYLASQDPQKSASMPNLSNEVHLRFDFRPIYDEENPINVREPKIVISAITADQGVSFTLAGFKTKNFPRQYIVDIDLFQQVTGLQFGVITKAQE